MFSTYVIITTRQYHSNHTVSFRTTRNLPTPAGIVPVTVHRRKSRSLTQRERYQHYLSAINTSSAPIPSWDPPKYLCFYKISGFSTPPKVGKKLNVSLIPAMLNVSQGQVYVVNSTGCQQITIRPNMIKPIHSMDGSQWYNILASVIYCKGQTLELPQSFLERIRYYPGVGDRIRFVYCPEDQAGAIQSYSEGNFGRVIKDFTAPYFHFDNCIQCQNETHQIGYIVANGPRFDEIDYLYRDSKAIKGKIFSYRITKIVCAKDNDNFTVLATQSLTLRVEILRINAQKDLLPNYCMVVGRVLSCSRPTPSREMEHLAKAENESDANLFCPGSYIYIDHYLRHASQNGNPYSVKATDNAAEVAQICYIIGPKTPESGSFPIRPFS